MGNLCCAAKQTTTFEIQEMKKPIKEPLEYMDDSGKVSDRENKDETASDDQKEVPEEHSEPVPIVEEHVITEPQVEEEPPFEPAQESEEEEESPPIERPEIQIEVFEPEPTFEEPVVEDSPQEEQKELLSFDSVVKQKYKAVKGDQVDEKISQIVNDLNFGIPVAKIGENKYMIGTEGKMVNIKGANIMVRIGGGWQTIVEYIKQHEEEEMKRIQTRMTTENRTFAEIVSIIKKELTGGSGRNSGRKSSTGGGKLKDAVLRATATHHD